MAATNKTRAARAVTGRANGHSNGNRSYVVMELSSDDVVNEDRIPLFSIDGTEYTMPAEVPGNISLQVTDIWATDGEAAGTKWLMTELLGEDGYLALRECKTITKAQMRQVIQIMVKHALGEDDPKSPLTERCEQVAWVRDHLADLASDFSAIHGIRDMLALPGPVFLALAYRLSAYQGVMAARSAEQDAGDVPAAPEAPPRRTVATEQVTPRAVLQNDAAFAGIFSFGAASPA